MIFQRWINRHSKIFELRLELFRNNLFITSLDEYFKQDLFKANSKLLRLYRICNTYFVQKIACKICQLFMHKQKNLHTHTNAHTHKRTHTHVLNIYTNECFFYYLFWKLSFCTCRASPSIKYQFG